MNKNKSISICASAARPKDWIETYDSLRANDLEWEMVYVGPNEPSFNLADYPRLKFIKSNTKPAQCYQASFLNASGELLSWTADDAKYPPHALDDVYRYFKMFNNPKLVVAFRTVEDNRDITEGHRLRGRDPAAPRMAPFGVMNTEYFHKLGGYDRRFICGQSENDVVMRVYEDGGKLEIGPVPVLVHHQKSHNDTVFRSGYFHEDRKVLEGSWIKDGIIQSKRLDKFEPFSDIDILIKTQSQKGMWE
jgi:hypothetical protein